MDKVRPLKSRSALLQANPNPNFNMDAKYAIGAGLFFESVRALQGFRSKGGEILDDKGFQLREESSPYKALFGVEKDDIGLQNTYVWDVKPE